MIARGVCIQAVRQLVRISAGDVLENICEGVGAAKTICSHLGQGLGMKRVWDNYATHIFRDETNITQSRQIFELNCSPG